MNTCSMPRYSGNGMSVLPRCHPWPDEDFEREVGSSSDDDPAIHLRNGLWAAKDRLGEKTK